MGESWRWQLRDSEGQWIKMGSKVKWLSRGKWLHGEVVGSNEPGYATVRPTGGGPSRAVDVRRITVEAPETQGIMSTVKRMTPTQERSISTHAQRTAMVTVPPEVHAGERALVMPSTLKVGDWVDLRAEDTVKALDPRMTKIHHEAMVGQVTDIKQRGRGMVITVTGEQRKREISANAMQPPFTKITPVQPKSDAGIGRPTRTAKAKVEIPAAAKTPSSQGTMEVAKGATTVRTPRLSVRTLDAEAIPNEDGKGFRGAVINNVTGEQMSRCDHRHANRLTAVECAKKQRTTILFPAVKATERTAADGIEILSVTPDTSSDYPRVKVTPYRDGDLQVESFWLNGMSMVPAGHLIKKDGTLGPLREQGAAKAPPEVVAAFRSLAADPQSGSHGTMEVKTKGATTMTTTPRRQNLRAGDYVQVEQTRGLATSSPVTTTVEGVAYRDDEGTLRVGDVPLTRDADGFLPKGVVLLYAGRKAPTPSPVPEEVVQVKDAQPAAKSPRADAAAKKALAVKTDTRLAEIYEQRLSLQHDQERLAYDIQRSSGSVNNKPRYSSGPAQWDRSLDEAMTDFKGKTWDRDAWERAVTKYQTNQAQIDTLNAETAQLGAIYTEAGGWTRAFLVTNQGGHVHRSMSCSTCYPTTRFHWLPEYSGSDEDQIVGDAGERACTVCYPSAPVNVLNRPTKIFSEDEKTAAAARVERAAAKTARDAAKAAKAITNADGTALWVMDAYDIDRSQQPRTRYSPRRFGEELKTEMAARQWFVRHEADLLVKKVTGHGGTSRYNAEAQQNILDALAAKHAGGLEPATIKFQLMEKARVKANQILREAFPGIKPIGKYEVDRLPGTEISS